MNKMDFKILQYHLYLNKIMSSLNIGILGAPKVGKTYLACKLVEKDFTQQDQNHLFQLQIEHKGLKVTYHTIPINENKLSENVHNYNFDMIITLFKDSDSFQKIYEFMELIKEKQEILSKSLTKIKAFIVIYSNYEEKAEVQTTQLFHITEELIKQFNRNGQIVSFLLDSKESNFKDLKELIQSFNYHQQKQEQQVKQKNNISIEQVHHEKIEEKIQVSNQNVLQIKENQQQNELIEEISQNNIIVKTEEILAHEQITTKDAQEYKQADKQKKNSMIQLLPSQMQGVQEIPDEYKEKKESNEHNKETQNNIQISNQIEIKQAAQGNLFQEFRKTDTKNQALDQQIETYNKEKLHKIQEEEQQERFALKIQINKKQLPKSEIDVKKPENKNKQKSGGSESKPCMCQIM